MPTGKPIPGSSMTTRNGYFWNYGEVLAQVFYGPEKKMVGSVRLCGMDNCAKNDVLGSKGPSRTFDMWFKDLCTIYEYTTFCEKVRAIVMTQKSPTNLCLDVQSIDNSPRCNAWMEGFEDTNPALFHMTEELRERNAVAIYRPEKAKGNVWLAYSRKSLGFHFLNWNTDRTPAGVPIYLAVRPPLAPTTVLKSREREEPNRTRREFPDNVYFRDDDSGYLWPSEAEPNVRARRPSLSAIDLEKTPGQLQRPTRSLSHDPSHHGPESDSSTTRDPRRRQSSPVSRQDYVHPSRRGLVEGHVHTSGASSSGSAKAGTGKVSDGQRSTEGYGHQGPDAMDLTPDVQGHSSGPPPQGMDAPAPLPTELMEYFQEKLKMSVQVLASLDEKGKDDLADNFYLHFPQENKGARDEYAVMETWLKAHGVMVWTDWGKFLRNSKRGVVIVCSPSVAVEDWPELSTDIHSFMNPSTNIGRCGRRSERLFGRCLG